MGDFVDGERAIRSRWSPELLNPDRVSQLITDLIPNHEIRMNRRYGVHIIDGSDPSSDIGRFVEWTVFDEYFSNDLSVMEQEYGPYDKFSTFIMVLDYDKIEPVGVIRIISPSDNGLKSINDMTSPGSPWYCEGDTAEGRLAEVGVDANNTVDIATMAVMPEYRSNHAADGVSAALYSTCVRWSMQNNCNGWVATVDSKIYNMMQAWGEPFKDFDHADWAAYLDSLSSKPVHLELLTGLEKIKKLDVEMSRSGQLVDVHGLYTRGAGLEDKFVLPAFDV
ncbi:hypothetical protein KC952_04105 [Candidatus Saccharibacteria bacterium]|jgi:hypothetical protein|nr:hypothetical protein [Candidatus Saccharibacteria bacterium]